ncbi:MAG: ACP S-malonyltransferase [Limnochordaceae bacterium]|nr:ACP S-malonyltransferase [Limnochordaceae bacterium]
MASEGWVWLFPGQGSQVAGMGQALAARSGAARTALVQAEEITHLPLRRWMWEGDEESLRPTSHTQPALLAVELAYLAFARERGASAVAAAGHSVGEYAALVAAGVLSPEHALRLVTERGRLMEEAFPEDGGGMMAVLGLPDAQVEQICQEAASETGELVEAVNYNCPGQVVIAGTRPALARARQLAQARGARLVRELAVSGPFHSRLMRPAAERLRPALAAVTYGQAQIPVISNVLGRPYSPTDSVADLLYQQVWSPVRWAAGIQFLFQHGYTHFVELGPGTVLAGLVRRILAGQTFTVVSGDQPEWEANLSCQS